MNKQKNQTLSLSFQAFVAQPGAITPRPSEYEREFELRAPGQHKKPWILRSTGADVEMPRSTVRAWENRGWVERIYRLICKENDWMLNGYRITALGERVLSSADGDSE